MNSLELISYRIPRPNVHSRLADSALAPLADSRGRPPPAALMLSFLAGEDFLEKEWWQGEGGNGSLPTI